MIGTPFTLQIGLMRNLVVGASVMGFGVVLVDVALYVGENDPSTASVSLVVIGLLIGLVGFAWLCAATVCPRCRVNIVWQTMRGYANGLLLLNECPKCGYDGRD